MTLPIRALIATTVLAFAPPAPQKGNPPRAPKVKPPPPPRPAPPLPMLPSVGRVNLEIRNDAVVVTEDVNLPRGDYRGGALTLFAAFGAPGLPNAVDAKLLTLEEGALEAAIDAASDKLDVELASRALVSMNVLLGSGAMAGVAIRIPEAIFLRHTAKDNMAVLRIRTLMPEPEEDATGAREIIVRLGTVQGQPITLGRIDTDEHVPIGVLGAEFCGKDAEKRPLAVGRLKKGATTKYRDPLALAPVLSTRHNSDDLCVKYRKKK